MRAPETCHPEIQLKRWKIRPALTLSISHISLYPLIIGIMGHIGPWHSLPLPPVDTRGSVPRVAEMALD